MYKLIAENDVIASFELKINWNRFFTESPSVFRDAHNFSRSYFSGDVQISEEVEWSCWHAEISREYSFNAGVLSIFNVEPSASRKNRRYKIK